MAVNSGELLAIQNNTGAAVVYRGATYANGAFVPMSRMTSYKVQRAKLWSADTGRSMTGENKGTLVGIFPKITITGGKMSQTDMAAIARLTDQAQTNIRYFDPATMTNRTASFYFGDLTSELARAGDMTYRAFEVNAIANRRME